MKEKEGVKLIIFASSIFETNNKKPVRKAKFEIQQYGADFKQCRYCGGKEVRENYFIPQKFLDSQRLLKVDLIQLSYSSSPRGVRKIIVGENDFYNNYKGWGNYPSNLYIPIKEKWLTIKEAVTQISVIAVQNKIIKENLDWDQKIGTIQTGNEIYWDFYLSIPFQRDNEMQFQVFSHPSCVKNREFFLLDEEDLKNSDKYFEKVGEMYVSPRGDEILYKGKIYVPYLTTNKSLCLLEYLGDKGIIEKNKTISYRRYDDNKVMIYENEKFIDYATPCILSRN